MQPKIKVFKGGTLIDGNGGKPIPDSVVIVEGNKITDVGVSGKVEIPKTENVEIIDAKNKTVMPGLIDTHVHNCMDGEAREFGPLPLYWTNESMLMKSCNQMKRTLDMGITTVREGGSGWNWMEVALRDGIKRGDVPGPRMQATGYHITVTGGHGYFLPYWLARHKPPEQIGMHCDGPDEWRKAARINIYMGVDNVKIVNSRDIISPGVEYHSQASFEEVKAAFDEAHARDKGATAHSEGHKAIMDSIKAGANSIVHGFWMDDECADLMAEKGVYWEGTNLYCSLIKDYANGKLPEYMLKENPGGLPDWMLPKAKAIWEDKVKNFKRLVDRGVKILFGSDAGCPYIRHGYNAMELSRFVELGISPMNAILAATKVAAEALRWQDQIGTVEKGKLADIIMVDGDPLKDISVLHTPEKIKLVMQDGHIVKTR